MALKISIMLHCLVSGVWIICNKCYVSRPGMWGMVTAFICCLRLLLDSTRHLNQDLKSPGIFLASSNSQRKSCSANYNITWFAFFKKREIKTMALYAQMQNTQQMHIVKCIENTADWYWNRKKPILSFKLLSFHTIDKNNYHQFCSNFA